MEGFIVIESSTISMLDAKIGGVCEKGIIVFILCISVISLTGCGLINKSTDQDQVYENAVATMLADKDPQPVITEDCPECPKCAECAACAECPECPSITCPEAGECSSCPECPTATPQECPLCESENEYCVVPACGDSPEDPDERNAALEDIVRAFINRHGYVFEYDSIRNNFSGYVPLQGTVFGGLYVNIKVYDDLIVSSVSPEDFSVPEETREDVATLFTLANYEVFGYYSFLLMDFSDGYILSYVTHSVEKVLPTVQEIEVLVHEPFFALQKIGNVLYEVAEDNLSPYQVIKDLGY